MYSVNRNSYLQKREHYTNARLINRCVDLARNQAAVLCFDSEPPFNRLCSQKPCIPVGDVDLTRRPVAFGRWALPKLRRELHSTDPQIVLKAAASISDLVHDPEKAYEAIDLDIPKRMADCIIHDDPSVREYIILAYTTLAGLEAGRMAIVKNTDILYNFALILNEYPLFEIRIKVAKCLEVAARSWIAADYLVEHGFVQKLLFLLDAEFIDPLAVYYLDILQLLMYGDGKQIAISQDGFRIFANLLDRRDVAILKGALDCLLLITSTEIGKEKARETNLLKKLQYILKQDYSNTDPKKVITMKAIAVGVIMFCTIETRAKVKASRMKDLPEILINLAKIPQRTLQLYSLKALTNICEHWRPKQIVKDNFCEDIANITLVVAEEYRTNLLMIINWVPTSNT